MTESAAIREHDQCTQIIEAIQNGKYYKTELEKRRANEPTGVKERTSKKWFDNAIEKQQTSIDNLKKQYNNIIKKLQSYES